VDNIREYDDNYSTDDGYHAAVYIRYDNSYDIYERTTYSLLDWLGDIGGLSEALFFIGAILVSNISEKLMISSILKKTFQLKRHPNRSYRKKILKKEADEKKKKLDKKKKAKDQSKESPDGRNEDERNQQKTANVMISPASKRKKSLFFEDDKVRLSDEEDNLA